MSYWQANGRLSRRIRVIIKFSETFFEHSNQMIFECLWGPERLYLFIGYWISSVIDTVRCFEWCANRVASRSIVESLNCTTLYRSSCHAVRSVERHLLCAAESVLSNWSRDSLVKWKSFSMLCDELPAVSRVEGERKRKKEHSLAIHQSLTDAWMAPSNKKQ